MNYKLNIKDEESKGSTLAALRNFIPLMHGEGKKLAIVALAICMTTGTSLVAPMIIGHTIDTYIVYGDLHGILMFSALLLGIFFMGLIGSYVQTQVMGGVARRVLFNLRNALFTKIQELPVAFFNQNKAGDLISRINNDTDKLNNFFGQAIMQFLGSFFLIVGTGIFLLSLNFKYGAAILAPAAVVLVITQLISTWVKQKNFKSLQSTGSMSGEIQESLVNFKVIAAFNRLDYFRNKFEEANELNYKASIGAGIANNIFTPLYTLATSAAQLIVIVFGIYLIQSDEVSLGLLISFLLYANNFYSPLRQLASVWSSLQQALAAFDRISEVLRLSSDMQLLPKEKLDSDALLEFRNVSFGYPEGKVVLHNINLALERGKTYALVGPTGGGKTTTASLMARLYDPTEGTILLEGQDIRSYEPTEKAAIVGFILQEPFLFRGTVRDNITYANQKYHAATNNELLITLKEMHLEHLLARFENGLDTKLGGSSDSVSLGQKQLIAFMRAILREPRLLILDEATANIDTVTEAMLEDVLAQLPKDTTKVIIAHRLNTIANADEIFFVNGGEVTKAGSMDNAVELLLHGKRAS